MEFFGTDTRDFFILARDVSSSKGQISNLVSSSFYPIFSGTLVGTGVGKKEQREVPSDRRRGTIQETRNEGTLCIPSPYRSFMSDRDALCNGKCKVSGRKRTR